MFFSFFFSVFFWVVPQLGVCTAKNANPAAEIMWLKNNQALMDDGKGVQASILITDQIRPHAFVQFLTVISPAP